MPDKSEQPSSLTITKRVAELLERGAAAVVITVTRGANIGAKLLVDEFGDLSGSLGTRELDSLVVPEVSKFFRLRDEK